MFFGGGRGFNPGPCIFYALSILTELSSQRQKNIYVFSNEKVLVVTINMNMYIVN